MDWRTHSNLPIPLDLSSSESPLQFETLPRTQYVPEGAPVLLECQVMASEAADNLFEYVWTRNGKNRWQFASAAHSKLIGHLPLPPFTHRIHNNAPKDGVCDHTDGFVYPGISTCLRFRGICVHRDGFIDGCTTIHACGLFERTE